MDVIEAVNPCLYCQEVVERELARDRGLRAVLEQTDPPTAAWLIADKLYPTLSTHTRGRVALLTFKTIVTDAVAPVLAGIEAERQAEADQRHQAAVADAEDELEHVRDTHGLVHSPEVLLERMQALLDLHQLRCVRIRGDKWQVRRGRKRRALRCRARGRTLASSPDMLADALAAAVQAQWARLEPGRDAVTYWVDVVRSRTLEGRQLREMDADISVDVESVARDLGLEASRADTPLNALIAALVGNALGKRRWEARRDRAKRPVHSSRRTRR